MPPFDREGALKSAEKALRLGRIDVAIAEYLRIVQVEPRDWNSANALGDLYVRANQIDKAVAQYTRIADHLAAEGFYPKAAAVFKKISKVKPSDEYSLLQSGELAAKQGLFGDAKNAFHAVAERRRARGDKRGAAEINIRIGTLDPENLKARLGAARAAAEIGDTLTALREFKEVAVKYHHQDKSVEALAAFESAYELAPSDADVRGYLLTGYLHGGDIARAREVADGPAELKQLVAGLEAAGRRDDILEVLEQIATLDPGDLQVRSGLAQAYAAKGDLARARLYLNPQTAGRSATLWLTLAELELTDGRVEEGRSAIVQALTLDGSQREAAVALGCRLAESSADASYLCLDAVADHALGENDYAAAAAALHEFVTRVHFHVTALMRLVEICVDGGLEGPMYEAQAQLADAYLEVGRGFEARVISEDLIAREPWNRANVERFRKALVMLGESDSESLIAERLSGDSPFLATDRMDLNEGVCFDDEPPALPQNSDELVDFSRIVIPPASPIPSPQHAAPGESAQTDSTPESLDEVLRQMRDEVERASAEEAAEEQFGLAQTYRELGMIDDAIHALQGAADSPRQRFNAASMLGALYVERGETERAIEWFGRAAEAPAPTADARHALLYDLAETLEQAGKNAQAMTVFVELETESGGYRDVARRIDRLESPH